MVAGTRMNRVTTWRVIVGSSSEMSDWTEARLTKDASRAEDGKLREYHGASTRGKHIRDGRYEILDSSSSSSIAYFHPLRKRERTSERERATLPARTAVNRWSCYGSTWRMPARRNCMDTNRADIHPRIFNIPPSVWTISTISQCRK